MTIGNTNRSWNRIFPRFPIYGLFFAKILFQDLFVLPIVIPGPISGPIRFPILGRRPETYFLAGRLDRKAMFPVLFPLPQGPCHTRNTTVIVIFTTVMGKTVRRQPTAGSLKHLVFPGIYQSRFWGRGCDEALFSEKKGFSVKRGEAIQ